MNVRGQSRTLPQASALRAPLTVAVYTAVFFGALPALLWVLGGRLDACLGLPALPTGPWRATGAGLAAAGVAWMAWSMLALHRIGDGWPISHLPPRRLVAAGPYAWMRHPIYVGYTTAFIGASLAAGSLGRVVGAGGFLTAGWLIYALGFEEPRLLRRFGRAYAAYRAAVGLWRPRSRVQPSRFARAAAALATRCLSAVEWLANRTVLFRLGPTIWVTYAAMVALGAAVMAAGLVVWLADAGVPRRIVHVYVAGLAVAMLLGGRVMWLLYHVHRLRREMRATLGSVGFVSWGGYAALFAFVLAFAWATGLDPLALLDRTLLAGLACSAFGRLGCLTYGCCYGRPTRHGIRWTNPDTKVVREHGPEGSVPRVATPLLSALHAAVVVAALLALTHAPVRSGVVAALGLLLYAFGRFAVECLREQPRYLPWGLSSGQIGSVLAATAGIVLLLTIDGPPGWPRPATAIDPAALLPFLPSLIAATALVFLVCGFHWKAVGRWP